MTPRKNARRLLLVRHAKSAWPDVPDRERPLAPRGRRQAPLAGRWLRDHGLLPDLVVCSTARRAVETWQLMAAELDHAPPVRTDERIYGATAAEVLEVVRQAPPTVTTLLVVGHAPGLPDLADALTGDSPLDDRAKFPTGAIAAIAVATTWRDLGQATARLTDFVTPRELERR